MLESIADRFSCCVSSEGGMAVVGWGSRTRNERRITQKWLKPDRYPQPAFISISNINAYHFYDTRTQCTHYFSMYRPRKHLLQCCTRCRKNKYITSSPVSPRCAHASLLFIWEFWHICALYLLFKFNLYTSTNKLLAMLLNFCIARATL